MRTHTCARLQGSNGGHQRFPAVPLSHNRLNGTAASGPPMSSPAFGQFISNPMQGPLSPPARRGPSHHPRKSHSGVYHSDLWRPLI